MPLDAAEAARARVALHRFGLGPRPGGPERIGSDPLAALRAELEIPDIALIENDALPSRKVAGRQSQKGFSPADDIRMAEIKARIDKHLSVEIGFVERLVIFWSNHFSMSINKDDVIRATIGQLERDVIRRHVLGKFTAMHRGVMQHPGMIRYLDNQDSIGPNSKTGREWGVGFNENLARELMELHTVGSGGGYTEADVTAMAKVLTGWTYIRGWETTTGWDGASKQNVGQFHFRSDWHEPGAIEVMGVSYAAEGMVQGEKVLLDLARRRATAQHIAFKLVRHFITDEPTPEMVDPVANAFQRTKGDLKATTLALLALPAAFDAPLVKIRTPYELAVAQFRALGKTYTKNTAWAVSEPLRAMDNLPWERPAPDGYSDETYTWLDPDGMTIRLDTAMLAVDMFAGERATPARKLAQQLYGEALSSQTAKAIGSAADNRAGLTILFMSPEFQRR